MSIKWQATAECKCGETCTVTMVVDPFRVGTVAVHNKPDGWGTNPVRCPSCFDAYVRHRRPSAVRNRDDNMTNRCTDSRHRTIGGGCVVSSCRGDNGP